MDIENLLCTRYGLYGCCLDVLEGYESVNYKVTAGSGVYVLKKYGYTKEIEALINEEDLMLTQLALIGGADFPATVVTNTQENHVITNGNIYRLLTYVHGDFLAQVPHTPTLLHSFGRFLAKMDQVIYNGYHAAVQAKETPWDLKHFNVNYAYLDYVEDPKQRSLVEYFFLQYDTLVLPVQSGLRKGIIHNDANDWNVLVNQGVVSGIIDFGDMCHSWLINELAVAITYVMLGKDDPLETAAHVIKGYHELFALKENELDILYYLVAARLCTSVCNSAFSKTQKPESEYITISEKPAWKLLHQWAGINPILATNVFKKAAGYEITAQMQLKDQLARRNANLGKSLSLSYAVPIQMQSAAFQYMYDSIGATFLDAYNNIMLVGHCHPHVVKAGQRTMARLNTNTRYIYDELLGYSDKLLAKFPEKLNKVFFVNSGSAASDLAIRMATAYTKKNKIMVMQHGYHGNTAKGIEISAYKYNHRLGHGKKEHIIEAPLANAFASGFNDDGTAGAFFAKKAADLINANEHQIAAFIAEPIVGCGGQVPLAKGFLQEIYPLIQSQGGVCISDEVQVGFGRLGNYFWGYEMHGVVPDMVILGKPMGNGHPIGAVVTTTEIADGFAQGPEFFSSFGGNPVSCAIGRAVLEVIEKEDLQSCAKLVGDHLMANLRLLQKKYVQIADVRGSGLFIGVELVDTKGKPGTGVAAYIKNGLREKLILVGTDGPYDNVLKIKPPLRFTMADANLLVAQLDVLLADYLPGS